MRTSRSVQRLCTFFTLVTRVVLVLSLLMSGASADMLGGAQKSKVKKKLHGAQQSLTAAMKDHTSSQFAAVLGPLVPDSKAGSTGCPRIKSMQGEIPNFCGSALVAKTHAGSEDPYFIIMTAAHCVADVSKPDATTFHPKMFDSTIVQFRIIRREWRTFENPVIWIMPNYFASVHSVHSAAEARQRYAKGGKGHDVALLLFKGQPPDEYEVLPFLRHNHADHRIEAQAQVTVFGYGYSSPFNEDDRLTSFPGVVHEYCTVEDDHCEDGIMDMYRVLPARDARGRLRQLTSPTSRKVLNYEAVSGDSGGANVWHHGNKKYLIGVNSFIDRLKIPAQTYVAHGGANEDSLVDQLGQWCAAKLMRGKVCTCGQKTEWYVLWSENVEGCGTPHCVSMGPAIADA